MKKTICIFSALYEPHVGGVENYTKELSKALLSDGFRVIIVTNNHANFPGKTSPQNNLTIFRLPCFSLFNDRLPLPKKNTEFRKLFHELQEENIDHVCINTRFYPHSLIGAKLAYKKGLHPIVIEHGSNYLTFGNPLVDPLIKLYERAMTKKLKRFQPCFYAVSTRGSKWLKTFNILSEGEVHNAIDVDSFLSTGSSRDFRQENSIAPDVSVVAFVGRLTPEKGINQLVRAASFVAQQDKSIYFLIAGDGPLLQALKASAPHNVTFLGALSQPDIVALLSTSDIFCLPSRSEGFATVLLEAAACSAAPVVTNVGGVDELIPNKDYGVILPDQDARSIASALIDLCDNRELIELQARNINMLVSTNYNWQETASALIEAFNKSEKR